MPRIARILNEGEPTIYHVMSRTALDGYPLKDHENEYLLGLIKKLSNLYFIEVLGFCLMGNHFHLLLRVFPEKNFMDDEIRERVKEYYNGEKSTSGPHLEKFRSKLGNLSEFMKEVKQEFTRRFNKENQRKGFFWGQRYKSLIVENGDTLMNCLAYIDLNPVRAGIVDRPEDYRWNTLGYLIQTNNKDQFLNLDFGVQSMANKPLEQQIVVYREFVYETGALKVDKGKSIKSQTIKKARKRGFKYSRAERFQIRTKYFTESGVIGSREFVAGFCRIFGCLFDTKKPKVPIPIQGWEGSFSMLQKG